MNTPVFFEPDEFGAHLRTVKEDDFVYGTIPGTSLRVGGPFSAQMEYHTAILGVTGCGKTELAFDLIRDAVDKGIKVVCIDITTKYLPRLADLSPRDLSLSTALSEELSAKLFDVETGQYGAGPEKAALQEFAERLRDDITSTIESFVTTDDVQNRVGVITLEEISNTQATLFITEIFLTCILHFARDNPTRTPRILIVVEEAHTVMPETSTMGLGDFASKGLVGKIAQIALQGRKYGVGLLVIAQRTATVSKTVLTQCNTILTLNCFDETSLGFLSNVYGATHVKMISNLPPLHAVVFGRGVRTERPVMIKIPFSEAKAAAGR